MAMVCLNPWLTVHGDCEVACTSRCSDIIHLYAHYNPEIKILVNFKVAFNSDFKGMNFKTKSIKLELKKGILASLEVLQQTADFSI